MKFQLDPTTTPEQKFTRFHRALRGALQVSKSDLTQMLADDEKIRRKAKAKPGPKPRRSSASGRAADSTA
jgi:hypothetical protein